MKKRVVITGIGPVSAIGNGKEAFIRSLFDKKMVLEETAGRYDTDYLYKTKFIVPSAEIEYSVDPMIEKLISRASPASILSLIAAMYALEDAGLHKDSLDTDCSVIIGTGFGNISSIITITLGIEKEKKFNRMAVPVIMPSG